MSEFSRRTFLGLAGGAMAAIAGTSVADAVTAALRRRGPAESLDAIARTRGMRFGSAMSYRQLSDPRYCELMRTQCGIMVTENALKWPQTQSGPDTFTFGHGDALAQFAAENRLALRGHNLLWQKSRFIPEWVKHYDLGRHPGRTLEKLLATHITTEMKRYPQIVSWDVVNEAVSVKTGELRETLFTRHLGQEAIDFCYHTARAAAPDAQLVYNDYMSWQPYSALHRRGVLRLLEGLRKRNVPVDALGVQSHIGAHGHRPGLPFGRPQKAAWRRFLEEVTGMGYALLITEFDVNDNGLPTAEARRDRMIADYALSYLDLMLSFKELKDVLTWGLVDKYSWLQHRKPRADGTPKRPLPFDSHYRPTPLYFAFAEAFRGAPPR